MKKLAFLLSFLVVGLTSVMAQNLQTIALDATLDGQTYEKPSEGVVIVCEGFGTGYPAGTDYIVTLHADCNDASGNKVLALRVNGGVDIAPQDTLYIYDGATINDPILLKINNNYANTQARTVFVSVNNPTSSLTIRFRSRHGGGLGWKLDCDCLKPCETVTPIIDSLYDKVLRDDSSVYATQTFEWVPDKIDTIFLLPDYPDSVIGFDTTWIQAILLCQGDGIIFHGHGDYTAMTGYYAPDDATSLFKWSYGNGDTCWKVGGTEPLYFGFTDVDCYDVSLHIEDARGCQSMTPAQIQVRLAQDPIKTIFDLATICNKDSLMVNVGYEGENGTLTLREITFLKIKSKTNAIRRFIPDGAPAGGSPCYTAPVTFNEFNPGQIVTSASDICSVCINYEHEFMGDYDLAITCPLYNSNISTTQYRAVLKYKDNSTVPSGYTPPAGTTMGGGNFNGIPYGGDGHHTYDGGDKFDSLQNPYGIGWNYCFSRNGEYQLFNGQWANDPNPTNAGLASNNLVSVTVTMPPIPAGYNGAGNSCGTVTCNTTDSSDHINKRGYYIPGDDFSTLVGCPLNGTWNIELCDRWGSDNGWVFNWSLDLCGIGGGGGCNYQVDLDSVVWRPDTNYATDFRDSVYTGLQIRARNSNISYISSPDTCGDFNINLTIYDKFHCQWHRKTHISTVCNPRPSLGPDTTLCGVNSTQLDARDKHSATGNYSYIWEPFGETEALINTHTGLDQSTQYVVEVTNYEKLTTCKGRDTILVDINPQPIPNFDPGIYPLEGCEPLSIDFKNTTKHGYKYRWEFGDGVTSTEKSPHHSYGSGQYDFKFYVESDKGCRDSLIYKNLVSVFPNPNASYTWEPVYPTVLHPSIQLQNRTDPDDAKTKYFWEIQYDRDNPLSYHTMLEHDPTFEWTATEGGDVSGSYIVRLIARTDNRGPSGNLVQCADTVENTIVLINDFLQFPSVVTPNGDGVNDRFVIKNLVEGLAYPINTLDIYNKWGSRVFHATNINSDDQFWDPAKNNIPAGTYFYRFSAKGYNGTIERNGAVEILK